MTAAKNKGGRPALPPGEKLVVVPVRLTEAQKAKLQRIGVQRLREWLDRVREPSAQRRVNRQPEARSAVGCPVGRRVRRVVEKGL